MAQQANLTLELDKVKDMPRRYGSSTAVKCSVRSDSKGGSN